MPGSSVRPLPQRDLAHVLEHTRPIWEDLRDGRVFVTGGSGFFGRWMLESLLSANEEFGLQAKVTVLTRDPGQFAKTAPHIAADAAVALCAGDVKSFDFPDGDCTHVLHLATESGPGMSPGASFATAVDGTRRVLAYAGLRRAQKLLLASSGAVYGKQPTDRERLSEDYAGAPPPEEYSTGYGQGKRAAEYLGSVAAVTTELQVKIARGFAFVGPLLPLDANFAIGNFIRDALEGDRIEVHGDGTARRSYLYAADLAVWLWTILVSGASGRPYNVGSEDDISIADLARLVGAVVDPDLPVRVAEVAVPGALPARYVPSTARATNELGLKALVPLDDAVYWTADWYRVGPMRRGAD